MREILQWLLIGNQIMKLVCVRHAVFLCCREADPEASAKKNRRSDF